MKSFLPILIFENIKHYLGKGLKPLFVGKIRELIKIRNLFKLFSPEHLLKLPFANDSNTFDKGFYSELLHIIGLTEIKEGGKKLIQQQRKGTK